MPSSRRRVPKYRHYKPKNLGVVRIDGRDRYLGKYDSPEIWETYHRLVAEWLASQGRGIRSPAPQNNGLGLALTIDQILLAYWKFAETYYVRDGEPTKELDGLRDSLRPLRRLYGNSPAAGCDSVRYHSRVGSTPGRSRTCDLGFRKALLYPLSYGGGTWRATPCTTHYCPGEFAGKSGLDETGGWV